MAMDAALGLTEVAQPVNSRREKSQPTEIAGLIGESCNRRERLPPSTKSSYALHREFLNTRKRHVRFPHVELEEGIEDLPVVSPDVVNSLDGVQAVQYLGQVQEPFRAALTLFYMNDASYQEIADILQVPLGTVRSRISRGIAQLKQFILPGTCRRTAEDA
jgi:DNA-directed RNA polymerase specialized sigma24 family protein